MGVGTVISPYYDSLLVKVTSWDHNFPAACRKAARAINEVRVRGVKTNIPFVTNILAHPDFVAGSCHTKFIDETPELFDIVDSRDRATRVLRYIAEIQVANPNAERKQYDIPRFPEAKEPLGPGIKQLLDAEGPEAVKRWVLDQKKLLLTDTTMRDAHQSLLSTRMRPRDMVKGADGVADILRDCFSLEMWGGATFDVAYRFLHESPWERLRLLREKIPNIPFQMLLRGSNLVGYANYPDNLVRSFIKEAAERGIDVFRVFDSLNWVPSMEVAMDEVLNQNKLLEATMCYTGDILDPAKDKYTLKYYVDLAKELEHRGAHMLAIKDMSGLLKPYAAKKLVSTLKQEIGIPIHLHTHNTSGTGDMVNLMAAMAGVDIVDTALSPLANGTSQPATESLVATLKGTPRDTGLDLNKMSEAAVHFRKVADELKSSGALDPKVLNVDTNTLLYQVPGGMLSNLISQLKQAGKEDKYYDVLAEIPRVREDFGYPPLVTPSSQIVGTQAVLNIITGERYKMVPKESKAMLRGEYGKLPGTVNEEVRAKAGIKPEDVITCRPADLLEPELPKYREEYKDLAKSEEDVLSLALFPQVAPKFINRRNLRTPKPHRTMAPIAHREAKERAVAPFSRK